MSSGIMPILDKEVPNDSLPNTARASSYQLNFRKVKGLDNMRWLVGGGLLCLLNFAWWFLTTLRIGYAPLFWLLAISIGFKILRMLHEWMHYAQVQVPVPPTHLSYRRSVDVLTTAYPGEPHGMIIQTMEAMQRIRYPHTSYLCDEGNDPLLRAACARLGVTHVTREVKKDAKAGNINNALRQATGEVCVVLDPDHVPTPDFLDQVMPFFEDERVGFVQVVQAYGNQQENLVARGAAEQTYHFYGPMMMGMNGYGTVQAIGANCTFRRQALDSIGGHAAGLTEDMHTAMRLHAAGWQSVYVPKVVSRGLVPASLVAFYSQQLKWSRGAFDLLFRVYPRLFPSFTWPQRLHYLLLPLYFFSGVIALIDLSLPVLSLGLSQFPWLVELSELAWHVLPLMAMSLLIRSYAQRWLREPGEGGLHVAGGLLQIGAWWIYTLGFVYAIIGVRVPYLPTPKEGQKNNEWQLALPNLLLCALLLAFCKYGRVTDNSFYPNMMVGLALVNIAILLAATLMGQHQIVRNFIQDMASWPFRGVVLRVHRLQVALTNQLVPGLRQFSLLIALATLLLTSTLYYIHADWRARAFPLWLLSYTQNVQIGQTLVGTEPARTNNLAGLWTSEAPNTSGYTIAALAIPAPSSKLPSLVTTLAEQHQTPLLSYSLNAGNSQLQNHWQALAREIAEVPGPVLLRPRLIAPTAESYRRAWKQMVETFRRAQVTNVIWVWTPELADPLLQRFPGVAFVDLLASPLQAADGAPDYETFRNQLCRKLAMHQLPVLLLAPVITSAPAPLAHQLAVQYPEIKAVVFAASTHRNLMLPNGNAGNK